MSFQEVTRLRKSGNLEEALDMALEDLRQEPQNIWCKRAISWVYYDFFKQNVRQINVDACIDYLTRIKELDLGEEENLLFDNCAWQIGSITYALKGQQPVNYNRIDSIFELIKDFHFTKPSEGYSFIFKAFHKGYQNWPKYLEFTDWWGIENFGDKDALPEEFNERKSMSLLEKACVGISKKMLAQTQIPGLVLDNHDEINEFIPFLDKVIENHPEFQYPVFYKVKLMLKSGNKDVLPDFIPFAKKKKNDYWVWELMAEILADDKDLQFACLCKALSFNGQDEFKVSLRQKFAKILLDKEMYSEAKYEVNKVKEIRESNGWNLPQQINEWLNSEWFKNNETNKNNFKLYKKHLQQAEEVLFNDVEEELIVVERINKEKFILNFVKSEGDYGFFNYKGMMKHPKIGNILKVRFDNKKTGGFCKVLTTSTDPDTKDHAAIKFYEGNIRITEPMNFGFVDDVFIAPDIISKEDIANSMKVKGKAILSYNKKKNEWGWKAFQIKRF